MRGRPKSAVGPTMQHVASIHHKRSRHVRHIAPFVSAKLYLQTRYIRLCQKCHEVSIGVRCDTVLAVLSLHRRVVRKTEGELTFLKGCSERIRWQIERQRDRWQHSPAKRVNSIRICKQRFSKAAQLKVSPPKETAGRSGWRWAWRVM